MTSCVAHTIAAVPVLLATPEQPPRGVPRRTVLWFHGFRADALAHAAELERCAAMGFLAVGIDAARHGARVERDPSIDHASRMRAAGSAMPVMLEDVDATLAELPALFRALATQHDADLTRVSLVGISMGAFLVYQAIADALPVRAAVALLGAPERDGVRSSHRALATFRDVALLSITAEHDASVPPDAAMRFHASLRAAHGGRETHRHHVLRGSGHLTTAAHWQEAMGETMRWLETHG